MAPSRIVQLASDILRHTERFDTYLHSEKLPTPSFEPDIPLQYELSDSASASRQAVIDAADELLDLMLGPMGPLLFPDVKPQNVLLRLGHLFHPWNLHVFPKRVRDKNREEKPDK